MAFNLRDLLGTVTSDSAGGGYDAETLLPSYPLEGYNVQYIGPGQYMTQGLDDPLSARDSYHYTYYPNWTIPTGATDVLFEIWGGGGGGAVSCCCSHGPGGGAGAYAYKRLQGADVVAGCQYQLCVATSGAATAPIHAGGTVLDHPGVAAPGGGGWSVPDHGRAGSRTQPADLAASWGITQARC